MSVAEAARNIYFPDGSRTNPPVPKYLYDSSLLANESELTLLLSNDKDRPGAVALIHNKIIPVGVRNALRHGKTVEADYKPLNTPMAIKALIQDLSIIIKGIDMAKLTIGQQRSVVADIEEELHKNKGQTILPGDKGRLRIIIGPRKVTATLERLDWRDDQWKQVRSEGMNSPQDIAHIVTRIDFSAAEKKLKAAEMQPQNPCSPPLADIIVRKERDVIGQLRNELLMAQVTLDRLSRSPEIAESSFERALREVDDIKEKLQRLTG